MSEMTERVRNAIQHAERFGTDRASAAIKAMREPTEAMLKRGADAQETPNKPIESIAAALSAYTAMIDEALKP